MHTVAQEVVLRRNSKYKVKARGISSEMLLPSSVSCLWGIFQTTQELAQI